MPMQSCSPNFQTKYAFFDNKQVSVEDYVKNKDSFKCTPKCNLQHELVLANGSRVRPYFRHKNTEDCKGAPMSDWHAEWQSNFETTETPFYKKNCDQEKTRRADAYLPQYNKVIEFQHSLMEKDEVDARKKDYGQHDISISWIIDGNTNMYVHELENVNRVVLEFVGDFWRYTSFLEYDYIYIDINEKIYKINPKNVKSHMIDVESPKNKFDFINAIKSNQDLWSNNDPLQCTLYVKQQGAGNGKTHDIIQMLTSEIALHYKNFIFVTKQHSAKYVMYKEFMDQKGKGKLNNIVLEDDTIVDNTENNNDDKDKHVVNKKYIIKYTNTETNTECQIIIATIDSLMYAIGNKRHTYYDKFEGYVNSIIDDYIDTDKAGKIKFGGVNPKLNKETLLVIDEAQDLYKNYAKAIINIMRNKYIDAYIVGDKLQSITLEEKDNAFIYLSDNDFPFINVNRIQPLNICRRFKDKKLVNFVNTMIDFDKYNLPKVTPFQETDISTNGVEFFVGESIYNESDDKENKINKEVQKFMSYFIKEVEQNNRKPEDFLIITPFTTNNPLVDAIQLSLNIYWKDRIGDESDEYIRYAIFHKSEEGNSINLDESEKAVRIVSTHSSKGDTRDVVFLVGYTESALKRFSVQSNNLIYDSLFHVALTRMRYKLYIRYEDNGDDICIKLKNYIYNTNYFDSTIVPTINVYNNIKYKGFIDEYLKKGFDTFQSSILDKVNLPELVETNNEKKIIDMGNHNIRYASLLINVLTSIVNKEQKGNDEDIKKQVIAILYKISNSKIIISSNWQNYNNDVKDKKLAIMRISNKGRDYIKYFDILYESMLHILYKLKHTLNHNTIPEFCPLECVILHYMIGITHRGVYTDIHINDIYNIIDIYSSAFAENCEGHDICVCKRQVKMQNKKLENNLVVKKMNEYIFNHFENIKNVKKTLNKFHCKYPKISWLHAHNIEFHGYNKEFQLDKWLTLIGYDDQNVVIAYIKPQFNSLNYNETLITSIFDTFLLKNISKSEENFKRFNGKEIVTCIFTLDSDEPYYINWNANNDDYIISNSETIRKMLREFIIEKYLSEGGSIYYFYKYWRINCPDDQKSPSKFIPFLKDKLIEIKINSIKRMKEIVNFIEELFTKIEYDIENCEDKKQRKDILLKYDNDLTGKDEFMKKLLVIITNKVDRYLNLNQNDEDDDD